MKGPQQSGLEVLDREGWRSMDNVDYDADSSTADLVTINAGEASSIVESADFYVRNWQLVREGVPVTF